MILRQVQQLVAIQVHHSTFKLGKHFGIFGTWDKNSPKIALTTNMDLRKKHGFWKGGGGSAKNWWFKEKNTAGHFFSWWLCHFGRENFCQGVGICSLVGGYLVQPIWKIYVKIYYSPNLWVEITIYLKPPTSLVGFCGSLSSCKPKKSTFLSMRHQFANKFAPHLVAVDGKKLSESCPTLKMLGYFFLQKS